MLEIGLGIHNKLNSFSARNITPLRSPASQGLLIFIICYTSLMDFNKIPKQFCENVVAGHSQENFVLIMSVGETANAYALTPPHMKRLVQSLAHQVGEYEKKFGSINAKWSPGIESPIQSKDIKGSGI
jgi:hypothetical protein